jgi:hypothetical protein
MTTLALTAPPARAQACDDCRIEQRHEALEFLARYDDPVSRGELRREAQARARRRNEELARQLPLDAEHFQRLVDMVADQDLELRVAWERCYADPACEEPPGIADYWPRHQQQLAGLLGEQGLRRMHQLTSLQLDRRFVEALAARTANYSSLTAAQASAVMAAVAQVRSAVQAEFIANGVDFMPYGECDALILVYANTPTIEGRVASARDYVHRLRDQIVTVLDDEQLGVFDRMQEELLSNLRSLLEREEARERRFADRL